jgi:hypothetical protein
MKKLEWDELWKAMEEKPSEWIPTTTKMFWEMLEVLPPRAQRGDAFLVGEALRHNAQGETVYACFSRFGENCYAKNLTLKEFKEATA